MARSLCLFCHRCHRDQQFVHAHRSHGSFSGGHLDWHCTICGDCSYSLVRAARRQVTVATVVAARNRTLR